ncbi:MAG: molybdopterin-binding protein [Candidatus Bathyarchaeota archaeon]|nr:molybdopterin-binding protein [Candidatus Bathyarchaeota archaeon]
MKKTSVELEKSVGKILWHDVTKIIKGKFKGPLFKKGHMIREEDLEELRKIGKNNIYVLELEKDEIHELDGAKEIAKTIAGNDIEVGEPSEGSVALSANIGGILKIDIDKIKAINQIGEVAVATQHTNSVVWPEDKVAVSKVIPLVVKEEKIKKVGEISFSGDKPVRILPFKNNKVSLVITGTEVYEGIVKDEFGPIMSKTIEKFGSKVINVIYVPDKLSEIVDAINKVKEDSDLIIMTGGMAVDPDDLTMPSVLKAGAKIKTYGAPVQPGFMFMLAELEGKPILGIPACAIFYNATIMDLVLPRVLAGENLEADDIISLAHGGLCLKCEDCRFPVCPFGRGEC